MPYSMTAFARQNASGDWGEAVWEIRSVNNRYLDINLRLPEELRSLEMPLREQIAARLNRGKIDAILKFKPAMVEGSLKVNLPLVSQLAIATREVAGIVHETTSPDPLDVLSWPGVIETPEIDLEIAGKAITHLMDEALKTLVATRKREGEKLAMIIEERCRTAADQVTKIRRRMPEIIQSITSKLRERVEEILIEYDETRLEQEITLLVQKMDVEEELDRLETHIIEVQRVLKQPGPIGRRLDFLMQEMNREANTLGSKSAHMESTEASIELKVLVEQMREQIQNIE